jgi:hypothetical protein
MEELIRQLERRVNLLEHEREIARVNAQYGPLIDTADPRVAELWTEDGVYDVDELMMEGADAVAAMATSPAHVAFVEAGCAHFQGPAHVKVDGAVAEAVNYSLMLVREESGYLLRRVTANHWSLTRGEKGWRVVRRTSRRFDGTEEAREVLRRATTSIAEESPL